MSEVGTLRIKNNRAQELIEIEHSFSNNVYMVKKTWRDLEKRIIETFMVQTESGWHRLSDLLPKERIVSFPEDTVELDYPSSSNDSKSRASANLKK